MCARFTITAGPDKIKARFEVDQIPFKYSPRYNLAPTQDAPVVVNGSGRQLKLMRWGLVPSWAKDPSIGVKMINARAETLAEKPSFRKPLAERRCLVVADGFYEWQAIPGQKTKTPMRFALKSREPFAFAGLWDWWKNPKGGELETFTLITTAANDTIRPVHDRMPVILAQAQETPWLDPDLKDAGKLLSLLQSNAADGIEYYSVSTLANSPKTDGPQCIVPVS